MTKRLSESKLLVRAFSTLEKLLGDESANVRLAAARALLTHVGASGASASPGRSTTEAALQLEEELQRRGDR